MLSLIPFLFEKAAKLSLYIRPHFSSPVMEALWRTMGGKSTFSRHAELLKLTDSELTDFCSRQIYSMGGGNLDDEWCTHPAHEVDGSWWYMYNVVSGKPYMEVYTMSKHDVMHRKYKHVFKHKDFIYLFKSALHFYARERKI